VAGGGRLNLGARSPVGRPLVGGLFASLLSKGNDEPDDPYRSPDDETANQLLIPWNPFTMAPAAVVEITRLAHAARADAQAAPGDGDS